MKRLTSMLLAAIFVFCFPFAARADYDVDTNYLQIMIEAASEGDMEKGALAEQSRNQKIDELDKNGDYIKINFEHLYLLSKIMHAEAGSSWLSDEWKMAVGEVVLNRIASPEFPDTMREVVEAPGQYYGKGNDYFDNLKPTVYITSLACRLLEGERVMGDPSVVFQSNYELGSGIFWQMDDEALGATYFCYSSHRELYEG